MAPSPVPRPRPESGDRTPAWSRGRRRDVALDEQPAPPAPGSSTGDLSQRMGGRAPDGRTWELRVGAGGIAAVMAGATVGEVHVWAGNGLVTLEFWVDGADLPASLSAHLVEQAFANPTVREGDPVLVCLPRRDGGLLEPVLRHVADARSRAVGMTCLLEGTVRDQSPPPVVPPPDVLSSTSEHPRGTSGGRSTGTARRR